LGQGEAHDERSAKAHQDAIPRLRKEKRNGVDSLYYEAQKRMHILPQIVETSLVPGVAKIGKYENELWGPTCTIIGNRVMHMDIDERTRDLKENLKI
jgi:hypothetical protein